MNFTREPIIETVITPKEGSKLSIRSSKKGETEEYTVDAIEVVSFGSCFFFRSLERPKSFLVPVTDYEVVEVKEMRMPLKSVSAEKSIKIGKPSNKPQRTEEGEDKQDKKRDKHRSRRRRSGQKDNLSSKENLPSKENGPIKEEGKQEMGKEKAPPVLSRLFPPPTTLIKEKLSHVKTDEILQEKLFSEEGKGEKESLVVRSNAHVSPVPETEEEKPIEEVIPPSTSFLQGEEEEVMDDSAVHPLSEHEMPEKSKRED